MLPILKLLCAWWNISWISLFNSTKHWVVTYDEFGWSWESLHWRCYWWQYNNRYHTCANVNADVATYNIWLILSMLSLVEFSLIRYVVICVSIWSFNLLIIRYFDLLVFLSLSMLEVWIQHIMKIHRSIPILGIIRWCYCIFALFNLIT